MMTLPIDSTERKDIPLLRGALMYFPAAIAGVATISRIGNDKHNPGQPMHHARGLSTDHGDCIVRHLMDIQDLLAAIDRQSPVAFDPTGVLIEVNQLAWRALAYSQELHERFGGAPLAPGARLPPTSPPDEVAAFHNAVDNVCRMGAALKLGVTVKVKPRRKV